MLELEQNGVRLSLLPLHGAAIVGLWFEGEPILHPARAGVKVDPTSSACFPMVPWCNRLSAGAIAAADGPLVVAANWPTTSFPVHGQGWLMPWDVVSYSDDAVTLQHCNVTPLGYSYEANLRVSLLIDGARFELSVRNNSDRSMPFGIGLHPYFPRKPSTGLELAAERLTRFDALGLPLSDEAVLDETDFRMARRLGVAGHSGLYLEAGAASLSGSDQPITLRSGGAFRHLQLWAPQGRDFLCIEPLSHRVDDFSRRATAAAHDLMPRAQLSGWMSLTIGGQ